ncbi:MAG: TolC family protein [Proteobacteria bacterium]|nr:TolC family protein [Pseudomonadota bacterium]NOG59842.1 TolC family protein [Pseudomonadota bacterium]
MKYLFFILNLLLPISVFAETDHDHAKPLLIYEELTLHDVVEKTYQRNPRLEVVQARLKHVDAQNNSTQSLWASDPTFNVSHYNDVLTDSDGLQEFEVGMELPLWLPGQKAARQKTFEQERSIVNASEPALKLEIAGTVRELLWNIALTKNKVSVAKKEWDIVKKLEQDVNKRVELGDLAQSNMILAQQESLSKEAAYQIAEQEFRHAQHRYDMITGLNTLPANYEEVVTDDISISLEHPALKESQKKVNHSAAQRDQVMLEKRGNPTLFVGTRHEQGPTDNGYDNAIGLSLSMPIGLTAYTAPIVTAAEVELSENRSQMEILHRELNITIQDASRELSSTIDQYDFARRQNELSKRNLALSRKAFSLGETGLIELIRIQAQAFAAERNMHQKYLEVGLQKARLNQAKGIIP